MKEYLLKCIDRTFDDEDYYNVMKIYEEEIKDYQKELEKADSIMQSCLLEEAKESTINFRQCLNYLTDYKSRIEKAIEYLETATIDPQSMLHYRGCLLEILRGEDNE